MIHSSNTDIDKEIYIFVGCLFKLKSLQNLSKIYIPLKYEADSLLLFPWERNIFQKYWRSFEKQRDLLNLLSMASKINILVYGFFLPFFSSPQPLEILLSVKLFYTRYYVIQTLIPLLSWFCPADPLNKIKWKRKCIFFFF